MDAYCLIEIYDVIKKQIESIGADFNEFIFNFLSERKTKIVIKKVNNQNGGMAMVKHAQNAGIESCSSSSSSSCNGPSNVPPPLTADMYSQGLTNNINNERYIY